MSPPDLVKIPGKTTGDSTAGADTKNHSSQILDHPGATPGPANSPDVSATPSEIPSLPPVFGPPAPQASSPAQNASPRPLPQRSESPEVPVIIPPVVPRPSARVASAIYDQVDRHFGHRGELQKDRTAAVACESPGTLPIPKKFGEAIDWAISKNFILDPNPVESGVYHSFSISLKTKSTPVSLVSHALCEPTESELNSMIRKTADSKTWSRILRFTKMNNQLRTEAGQSSSARLKLQDLWGGFMGCLSYVEALTDPDEPSSDRVARQVGFSNRPNGVLFYIDPGQSDPASRLNIGNFQFAPYSDGNIYSCLLNWNQKIFPSTLTCRAPVKGKSAEMMRWLAEPNQLFNSYCGVNKLVETFFVQANTIEPIHTSPQNRRAGGLSNPESRCVTPFITSGKGYNHFGPLQNTTGENLSELMNCVDSAVLDHLND